VSYAIYEIKCWQKRSYENNSHKDTTIAHIYLLYPKAKYWLIVVIKMSMLAKAAKLSKESKL
jgi:hypothetical protein